MSEGIENHNPEGLLADAVTPLIAALKADGYTEKDLLNEFSFCGFGKLQQLDAKLWETPVSHYGDSIYMHGKPHNSCYFNAGYIQGITELTTEQTASKLLGEPKDQYTVSDSPTDLTSYLTNDFDLLANPPARFEFSDPATSKTEVNEDDIIKAISGLPLYGKIGPKGDGLINAFGVVLTNHFADYYNRISYQTYFAMLSAGIPEDDIKEIFIQSGHICAFNTFGGIMLSPEWNAVIEPMCQTREDWFHGMVAVINALGWGTYRIEKIEIEKEFIVRIYNSYEGVGYRRMYPLSEDKNVSFLAMGGVLGLVHLLWKVDIRDRPTLNQNFYVTQFNQPETSYEVEQTHAIAAGDEYDRIVIRR
jgi:hypothetical protein